MTGRAPQFAAFGARPAFAAQLHVAQLNLPDWDKTEAAFRDIFARRYFANNGPRVRELDRAFADFIGVGHAVSVTNGTVGLMILAKALGISGEVIVPAATFPATVQALSWVGLTPVFCDIDERTHLITPETVAPLITERTAGILGVHLWGQGCDVAGLQRLADARGLALFFDACHAIGCSKGGRPIGGFGVGEVFSFHATKVVSGAEGGCITTNDAALADRLRTIRNFHATETFASVPLRLNGKMSEAQAAFALLSLADADANIAQNRLRYQAYEAGLAGLPGVKMLRYSPDEKNNYQYIVVEIDAVVAGLHRDTINALLLEENVVCRRHFYPGVHRMRPFAEGGNKPAADLPNTEALNQRLLQLPNGQPVTVADVVNVCDLLRRMIVQAGDIREALEATP